MLVQLIVGIPLEMVHGSLRIGAIYMAGVLAGETCKVKVMEDGVKYLDSNNLYHFDM